MTAWLHLIGMGADGPAGLHGDAHSALSNADIVIGGTRHLALIGKTKAQQWVWPSPFDALLEQVRAQQGKQVVVLLSGDPLWYSAGTQFIGAFAPQDLRIYPHISAFQLAATRMGWSMQETLNCSLHGRPASILIKHLRPKQRILALSHGDETIKELLPILTGRGFGDSMITALSHLGGAQESRIQMRAARWRDCIDPFSTLAIELVHDKKTPLYARTSALPDDAFVHDGKLSKQIIRAASMARLQPQSGQVLWDIGAGCGSIGIEWLRQSDHARAIGIESNAKRRAMAVQNAQNLGAPELELIAGQALDVLGDLPTPDAIFIGGGLCEELAHICYARLTSQGRLLINAVTLESEATLLKLHSQLGGNLERIQTAHGAPIGHRHSWRPAMPITQFYVTKP